MGIPLPDNGEVTEDSGVSGGLITASGDVDIALMDDTGLWTPQTLTGAYGSQLVIDADGVWTYTATNADPAIQALDSGETLQEVFTVTSTRGTTTVTITIQGQDEPPCFVRGTRIMTPQGPRAVEDLAAGDEVLTADHGPQPILWVGAKRVRPAESDDPGKLRPIRILPGAFGPGLPERPLLVSPMHRMAVGGVHPALLFGKTEVLCAARFLLNGGTIRQVEVGEVEYFHILLAGHEVIRAEGCATESLYPGPVGLSGFDDGARDELFGLFPELRSLPANYGPAARRVLKAHEGLVLARSLFPAARRHVA